MQADRTEARNPPVREWRRPPPGLVTGRLRLAYRDRVWPLHSRGSRLPTRWMGLSPWTVAIALAVVAPLPATAFSPCAAPLSLAGVQLFHSGDAAANAGVDLDERGWQPIHLPGSAGAQGLQPSEGIGWYRIHFVGPSPPPGCRLGLALGVVWGADEAFLNGVRIGGTGVLGPRPALPYLVDRVYPIPEGALHTGDANLLALHVQNGFDAWGLLHGPVRIGDMADLQADQWARELPWYLVDVCLTLVTLAALGIWSFFWWQSPRERSLLYLGAGMLGLLYLTVAGSLTFFAAGLLTPATYTLLLPAQAGALQFLIIGYVLFVSERRLRFLDALPIGFVVGTAIWVVSPSQRLDVIVSSIWLILCPLLALLFGWEVMRAVRRRAEGSQMMLVCAISVLALGVWGVATAVSPEPADWTMRYAVLPLFWVIPIFSLMGFTRRQLRTGDRVMQLSAQVLSAQSEERTRLSRELHDGVAQNLQAAKLGLQMGARGDVRQQDALKSATLLVSQSIDELRAVAQDQRSLEGGERSLSEALQRYAEILTARSGIDIQFEEEGTDRNLAVRDRQARSEHLYRIAQEAIGNAIRHGSARSIRIRLLHLERETRLKVEDDGAGFDLGRAEVGGLGMGLSTMRERAALIGGSCEIRSQPSGTCIEVRVRDST